MNIVVFGHLPSWAGGRQESGLANVIYQLAKHCSNLRGSDVTLVATDSFVQERKDGNLRIVGWTKSLLIGYMLKHPIHALRSVFRLFELKKKYPMKERFQGLLLKRIFFERSIRSLKSDIIHLHGPSAIWYLDLVPDEVKVAVTFHGMIGLDVNVEQHEVLYKIERDVFHSDKVDEFFFICTQLVPSFINTYGDNGKKNRVIFNSYDNTQFYYNKEEISSLRLDDVAEEQGKVTRLYTVASLSELKGQARVLSGLTLLQDTKKFKYYCIGADSYGISDNLKDYAHENDISFEYLGKKKPSEIRREMAKADYMIMPSSSEGFGLTYLEAIACGVPVILPKNIPIAAEKELINEKNSILLDDCSVESIAKVLENIDKWKFNREEVANSISGFSWDEMARQYVGAFEQL